MKRPFIVLIFFIAAHSSNAQPAPPFNVTFTANTPGTPHGVSSADFNQDGMKDLVVSIYTGSTVLVYPGNGDGTFGTPSSFAVGKNPTMVLSADLNNDGDPDIITPNYNAGNVSILLSTGNGSYVPAANLSAGKSPHYAVAADLNGDGKPDIAACNLESDNMHVYFGDGTGSFTASSVYTTGAGPVTLAANDLDNDGDVDLVSADHWAATNSVFLNNGTGTFSRVTYTSTQAGPYALACADFNSDHLPDILSLNGSSSDCLLNFYSSSTNGTFSASNYSLPLTTGMSAAVADYNKDGRLDFASAHWQSGFFFYGNGDGTFDPPLKFTSLKDDQMSRVISNDFNNDGMPDLAFTYFTINKMCVMLNTLPIPATGLADRGDPEKNLLIRTGPQKATMILSSDKAMRITVYNETGQLLWEGALDEHNGFTAELESHKGIYFVNAISPDGHLKRKVWIDK